MMARTNSCPASKPLCIRVDVGTVVVKHITKFFTSTLNKSVINVTYIIYWNYWNSRVIYFTSFV